MVQQELKVKNRSGIHVRPATKIANIASRYDNCEVTLERNGYEADGKSPMQILTIGAGYNSVVQLTVSGGGEQEALTAIAELFEQNFGE